ncbi:MAG: hypothetical protein ACFFCI_00715 [Promethearchaeota archaeon]
MLKTSREHGFSRREKEQLLMNLDVLSTKDLRMLKKELNVKTNAKTKAGLRKAIKKQLEVDVVKRAEVVQVDRRGYRGSHAENEVIDHFASEGWKVVERPSYGHDIVFQKGGYKRYYDVKEINEVVDSGKGIEQGRVQIDKGELRQIRNWEKKSTNRKAGFLIKINRANNKVEWKELSLDQASQLMRGKTDPVKLSASELESLPKFSFPGSQQSMFQKAKYEKYADIVDLTSKVKAQQAVKELEYEFANAKTKEKKLRVLRVTQLAANRARSMNKADIAKLYESASDIMQKQYGFSSNDQASHSRSSANEKVSSPIKKGSPVDMEVSKGASPWDLKVNVAKFDTRTRSKKLAAFDNTLDYSQSKRLFVTEKGEVADTIKQIYPEADILNLGGNPFYPVGRYRATKTNPVRKSKKILIWRSDKAYSPSGFQFPIVSQNTKVVVVSDSDYLGQYWNYHFSRLMKEQTPKVKQYAIETQDEEILKAVLTEKNDDYDFNKNIAVAGTWYVESLSEIGGTITSAVSSQGGIWDTFTESYRDEINWSTHRRSYLQGITSLNFTAADLALLQKVKNEQLSQKQRVKVFMETDMGLEEFDLIIDPMKPSSEESYYNAMFEKIDIKDASIKNTDDTVLLLVDRLKIQPSQAEDLIKRLASQKILSYPRTEYEGISQTQKLSSEDLADIWLSYYPEFSKDRKKMIQGIHKIKLRSGEIPKSGILVTKKETLNVETVEGKTVRAIAMANIQAALGAKEVTGYFTIQELSQTNELLNESSYLEPVTIMTRDPQTVGRVIDLKFVEKVGMTDREIFKYLADFQLGTIATRSNLVETLTNQGFLLKYKGEYKLDDRARILINALEESNFNAIKFDKNLKQKRAIVEQQVNSYQLEKQWLYDVLGELVVNLKNKNIQSKAINRFAKENQALEQIEELHLLATKRDKVEIK